MVNDTLDDLSVEELEALAARAQEKLESKRQGKRDAAIEEARSILASVGLSFEDVARAGRTAKSKRPQAGKLQQLKAGQRVSNPANPDQVWTAGKGRKPKWLMELEAKGEAPVPV